MIACFGYSGIASFTDIRLSSKNGNASSIINDPIIQFLFLAGIDPIASSHEICSWCDYLTHSGFSTKSPLEVITEASSAKVLKYEILTLQQKLRQSSQTIRKRQPSQVTFVSQVSMDRLTVLERSLQTWTGSVSIAIYIPVKSLSEGIQDWQRLYINKKISALDITHLNSTILLVPSLEADNYPINALRNLAIKMCRTRFMFLVDADFQPSAGLESAFISFLREYHSNLLKKEQDVKVDSKRLAFVVPAFEHLETPNVSVIFCGLNDFMINNFWQKVDPVLKSKDELIQLIQADEPLVQPFRFFESNEAHGLTNYLKWYHANEPYYILTKYHDKYEPYIIVEYVWIVF